MKHLHNYLKKFTSFISRDKVLRERVCEAIKLHFNKDISPKEISIQRETVFLSIHPTLKHIVLQNESDIITYVNNNPFGFEIKTLK